jgi:hypothetical protein
MGSGRFEADQLAEKLAQFCALVIQQPLRALSFNS